MGHDDLLQIKTLLSNTQLERVIEAVKEAGAAWVQDYLLITGVEPVSEFVEDLIAPYP